MTETHRPTENSAGTSIKPPMTQAAAEAPMRPNRYLTSADLLLRYAMVLVLVVLTIIAESFYHGFFHFANLNIAIDQAVPVGIIAVGMTFVIIGGGFDLSVGSTYAGAGVIFASVSNHMPLWVAFICTVIGGLVAGGVNAVIITKLNVNTFIATLASSSVILGAAYVYAPSGSVSATASGFAALGTDEWGGIWIATYTLVAVLVVGGVALSRTPYGRSVYAIGGNKEAARLCGMRVKMIQGSTFLISGACAAVAGVITASQTGVGSATIGTDTALDVITVVIIGGTSLLGGEGAMWRTFVGILIWGTLTNIFGTLAISSSVQLLITGGVLVFAVSMDSLSRRLRH